VVCSASILNCDGHFRRKQPAHGGRFVGEEAADVTWGPGGGRSAPAERCISREKSAGRSM